MGPVDARGPFSTCRANAEDGKEKADRAASALGDRPGKEPRVREAGGTCPGQCPVPAERLWHPRDRAASVTAGRTWSRTLPRTLPGRVPLPHSARCGSFPGVPELTPATDSSLDRRPGGQGGVLRPLRVHRMTFCALKTHPGLTGRGLTLSRVRTPQTAGTEHRRARLRLHGSSCPQCDCDQDLRGESNYRSTGVGQTGEDNGLFSTQALDRPAPGTRGAQGAEWSR